VLPHTAGLATLFSLKEILEVVSGTYEMQTNIFIINNF
jgi:hypothetical protein